MLRSASHYTAIPVAEEIPLCCQDKDVLRWRQVTSIRGTLTFRIFLIHRNACGNRRHGSGGGFCGAKMNGTGLKFHFKSEELTRKAFDNVPRVFEGREAARRPPLHGSDYPGRIWRPIRMKLAQGSAAYLATAARVVAAAPQPQRNGTLPNRAIDAGADRAGSRLRNRTSLPRSTTACECLRKRSEVSAGCWSSPPER
jgi:hypothetical protein